MVRQLSARLAGEVGGGQAFRGRSRLWRALSSRIRVRHRGGDADRGSRRRG